MEETNPSGDQRLIAEIELLEAMYPDQILWQPRSLELKFTSDRKDILELRLPDSYPAGGLPTIVSATSFRKQDLRQSMKDSLTQMCLVEGEEILDTVVLRFQDLAAETEQHIQDNGMTGTTPSRKSDEDACKTVIIWLHHLLATGKRKLALNPSVTSVSSGIEISGITKPGYPGIMLFTGPATLVDTHVAELKSQRWQAFQIRLEEIFTVADIWRFQHGIGISEVESMSDVVEDIIDKDKRELFLSAVGVK